MQTRGAERVPPFCNSTVTRQKTRKPLAQERPREKFPALMITIQDEEDEQKNKIDAAVQSMCRALSTREELLSSKLSSEPTCKEWNLNCLLFTEVHHQIAFITALLKTAHHTTGLRVGEAMMHIAAMHLNQMNVRKMELIARTHLLNAPFLHSANAIKLYDFSRIIEAYDNFIYEPREGEQYRKGNNTDILFALRHSAIPTNMRFYVKKGFPERKHQGSWYEKRAWDALHAHHRATDGMKGSQDFPRHGTLQICFYLFSTSSIGADKENDFKRRKSRGNLLSSQHAACKAGDMHATRAAT